MTLADSLVVLHRPGAATQEWWRHAVIYQVYPRSFADASGDGIGDLPGITQRLPYLARLGVDAVWLSPFYRSPQADAGYDVADYRDVDPLFGTLADMEALLARAHELGLRVLVDLVPNHTSDEHAWFVEALAAAPGSPQRERYLFRDGRGEGGMLPPNNWRSIFGGDAWTRVTEADGRPGQWYLHLFDTKQPDLNWENPQVRAEFEDVLRFWLDRGVDGFRVDVAHGMVKAAGLPDWDGHVAMVEGVDEAGEARRTPWAPMFDQEGVHEIYRAWHRVLAQYDGDRAMVAEAWVEPMSRLARYVRPDEMQQTFNFPFLAAGWDAGRLRAVIEESFVEYDAVGAPATWVLSNHDVVRHASRMGLADPSARPNGIAADDEQPDQVTGLRRARAATLLMLALPGSAYLYQGEELGLPDHTALPDELREDPAFHRTGGEETGRDGCRVPMPWQHDAPGLGFSPTGATWLPQPPVYADLAADLQLDDPSSTYTLYRSALALRREHALGSAACAWAPQAAGDVVAFVVGDVLVVTNLGADPVALPGGATVLLASEPLPSVGQVPTDTTVWAALH